MFVYVSALTIQGAKVQFCRGSSLLISVVSCVFDMVCVTW